MFTAEYIFTTQYIFNSDSTPGLSETMLQHQNRVTRGTRPFEGEPPAATLERARLLMQLTLN